MNRQQVYDAERVNIEKTLGYPISPEEAANMMAVAVKVVKVINTYSYSVNFKETRMILKLAEKALDTITGGAE